MKRIIINFPNLLITLLLSSTSLTALGYKKVYQSPCAQAYQGKKFQKALTICRRDALKGDAESQVFLANIYELAKVDRRRDYTQALFWYKTAAKQNYATAQTNLARLYLQGKGVRRNLSLAFYWFKKAAKNGDPAGQAFLSHFYLKGIATPKNTKLAVYWITKSANNGFEPAMAYLALMYRTGNGVRKNFRASLYWSKKSAEAGNRSAALLLGHHYAKGIGVKKNISLALKFYNLAVQKGSTTANVLIAQIYSDRKNSYFNPKTALKYYLIAAKAGNTLAQAAAAASLISGDHGIEKNYPLALKYAKAAAYKNYAFGQFLYASMHEFGQGVPVNINKALYWYRRAYTNGLKAAGARIRAITGNRMAR